MEKKLKQKVDTYFTEFKQNIQSFIETNDISIKDSDGKDCRSKLLLHIFDIEPIQITEQDFVKRKRTKNKIPDYERCCALKSDGKRCSRKRKDGEYCGTHMKGRMYGTVLQEDIEKEKTVTVYLEEINGVHKYIDKDMNVYSTEDIQGNVKYPRVTGKCTKQDDMYVMVDS
jgi:hypothetical protein